MAPPPAVSERRIKIRSMTQAKARPPHFVVFGNQFDQLPQGCVRFLVDGLRATFELGRVPLRITLRGSKNPFAGRK